MASDVDLVGPSLGLGLMFTSNYCPTQEKVSGYATLNDMKGIEIKRISKFFLYFFK